MEEMNLALTVLLSGLIVVFLALIALIFIIKGSGKIIGKFEENINSTKKDNISDTNNKSVITEYIEDDINNDVPEEIIAVISAAIYSIYGYKQKIHSVKRVKKSSSNRPIWGSVGVINNTRPFFNRDF